MGYELRSIRAILLLGNSFIGQFFYWAILLLGYTLIGLYSYGFIFQRDIASER